MNQNDPIHLKELEQKQLILINKNEPIHLNESE